MAKAAKIPHAARGICVRPVTRENWADFARLFESKGAPHYCWCTPHRTQGEHLTSEQRKACMREFVEQATPVGVLAYDGDEPVGWCSVAPRESYVKLRRSRTMPRKTPPQSSTWTVLCFYVPRQRRKQGIAQALLEGAVEYASSEGAAVIEGYPFDTAGITATHHGHSELFRRLGFRRDGSDRRWALSVARRPTPRQKGREAGA